MGSLCAGNAVKILARSGSGAIVCRRKSDPEWGVNHEILEYLCQFTLPSRGKRVSEASFDAVVWTGGLCGPTNLGVRQLCH